MTPAGRALARGLFRLAGAVGTRRPARTLVWHAIDGQRGPLSVPREDFVRQLELLVALGYRSETAGEVAASIAAGRHRAPGTVALTFDDGTASAVERGWPEVERRGLSATVFVVTADVGARPSWPARDRARIARDLRSRLGRRADAVLDSSAAALSRPLASWDALSGAAARGLEVLPHGRQHRFVDELDGRELDEEIAGAAEDLRRAGLGPPAAMAWPYGVSSAAAVAAARRAGFVGAFAADHPWGRRRDDEGFRLSRIPVSGNTTLADLRFALGPGYDLLALVRRWRRGNVRDGGGKETAPGTTRPE